MLEKGRKKGCLELLSSLSLFFFFFLNWGIVAVHSLGLVSALQRSKSAISVHVPPPSSTSFRQSASPALGHHGAPGWAPPVLRSSSPLAVCFTLLSILVTSNLPFHLALPLPHCVQGSVFFFLIVNPFYSLFLKVIFFFFFIYISWRLITLRYCSVFCRTLTGISHGLTRVPHPDPPPTSLPIPSLWVFPVHQPRGLVSCIQPGLAISEWIQS